MNTVYIYLESKVTRRHIFLKCLRRILQEKIGREDETALPLRNMRKSVLEVSL